MSPGYKWSGFATLKAIVYINWCLFSPSLKAFFILEDLNSGFLFPETACLPEPFQGTCSPLLPIPMSDATKGCCPISVSLFSNRCLAIYSENPLAFHECLSFHQEYWWNGKINPCWKFCTSLVRAVLCWSGGESLSEIPCCMENLGFPDKQEGNWHWLVALSVFAHIFSFEILFDWEYDRRYDRFSIWSYVIFQGVRGSILNLCGVYLSWVTSMWVWILLHQSW